jgi:hypothetical protein
MLTCPRCDGRVGRYYKFCGYCGVRFYERIKVVRPRRHTARFRDGDTGIVTCYDCGRRVSVYHRFCPYCGVEFEPEIWESEPEPDYQPRIPDCIRAPVIVPGAYRAEREAPFNPLNTKSLNGLVESVRRLGEGCSGR